MKCIICQFRFRYCLAKQGLKLIYPVGTAGKTMLHLIHMDNNSTNNNNSNNNFTCVSSTKLHKNNLTTVRISVCVSVSVDMYLHMYLYRCTCISLLCQPTVETDLGRSYSPIYLIFVMAQHMANSSCACLSVSVCVCLCDWCYFVACLNFKIFLGHTIVCSCCCCCYCYCCCKCNSLLPCLSKTNLGKYEHDSFQNRVAQLKQNFCLQLSHAGSGLIMNSR